MVRAENVNVNYEGEKLRRWEQAHPRLDWHQSLGSSITLLPQRSE
jgi:hypothetical protein